MKTKLKNIFQNGLVKKGLGDSGYYMLANVGSRALGFLVIPVLARSVSVESFANYDLFLLISALLQIFVVLGIDSGIVILLTEAKNDDLKLSFYYGISLMISLGLLILMTVCFGIVFVFIDTLFSLPEHLWYLIAIYLLFSVVNYHTFNFLRWRSEAKKAAFINFFAYVSGILTGLVFLYLDTHIESFLYGLVTLYRQIIP